MQEHISAERAREIELLRKAMIRNWWLSCLLLWLLLGGLSFWLMYPYFRAMELHSYFTWSSFRYMVYYEGMPALVGFSICFNMTLVLLIRDIRETWWGVSKKKRIKLISKLNNIHHQGPSHPQWRVIHPEARPHST